MDARVREREGCALEADKWGDMARVGMAVLRGLVVEIIFASRVVSVILRCGYCRYSERRSYNGRRYRFRETLRDGSMLPCPSGEDWMLFVCEQYGQ